MTKKLRIFILFAFLAVIMSFTANAAIFGTTKLYNPSGWEDDGVTIRTLSQRPVNISGNVSIGDGFSKGGIDLTTLGDILLAGDILIQGDILTITDQEINGSFLPTEDNKFDLGSLTKQWRDIYTSGIINAKQFSGNGTWNQSGPNLFPSDGASIVGIGTTSPNELLHVKKDQNAMTTIEVENDGTGSGAGARFIMRANSAAGLFGAFDDEFTTVPAFTDKLGFYTFTGSATPSALAFMTRSPIPIEFYAGGEEEANKRMVITGTGNIGIGTSTPAKTLHTVGDIYHNLSTDAKDFEIVNGSGTSLFFVDSSNKNVGIGTTGPAVELDISSALPQWRLTDTVGANIYSEVSGNNGSLLFTADPESNSANTVITFSIDNDEKVRIDDDGYVGIGTPSPSDILHVREDQNGQTDIQVQNEGTGSGAAARIVFTAESSAGTFGAFDDGYTTITELQDKFAFYSFTGGNAPSALAFMARSNIPIEFYAGGDEATNKRMTITGAGNVGIGTTSPITKLEINGTTTSDKINLGGGLTAFILNGVSLDAIVGATSQIPTELQYIGIQHSNVALSSSRFMLARSRGTLATPLIVQDGDSLTAFDASGFDGNDYVLAGEIDFEVDGTPGENDMPGKIIFKTTADGGLLPTERMIIDSSGNVGIDTTTPSEKLNVTGNIGASGNITSQNVFIPQHIYSHTNETIMVNGANLWTNVTISQEDSDIKQGITHTWNDSTNHTFTIGKDGVYDIDYDFDMEDTSPSASDIDVAGRLIYANGSEIIGSVFETDITKQGAEIELSHDFLAKLHAGDVIVFQFAAQDADVQISTHGTFGDYPESATIRIFKIANLP